MNPTRVLLISHTCQSRDEGQLKAVELSKFDDIELRVLVPTRWKHYGQWRSAEPQLEGRYAYTPEPVRFPWAGPAQSYLHHYPGLARVLRTFRPDVIDLWEEPWGLVSAHAVRLRNRLLPTAKVIAETEQNIDKHLPVPFEGFRRYTLRNAQFVVGRNAEALEIVRRRGYRGDAQVVPNAVDVGRFVPMDKSRCRVRLGIPDGVFVVGYVGRLVEEKGIQDLLDAFLVLPGDCELVVAGDGPMRGSIEAFVAAHGSLAGRVRALGAVAPSELPAVLNSIDVLALPSRTTRRWKEQFGRVIIEAHACGVPVIGSDSGAIPEVVGDGGLVVPERSPSALADAIRRLRLDANERRQSGECGRRRAMADFTWAAVARQMRDIYNRMAAQR